MLWRNGVYSPVGPVKGCRRVRRECDLLDAGAVAICRVDAFTAVDKHAENDPRPVWRPVGLDG
jgi:hypothetical protein